jgi:urease accessory protein
MVYEVYQRLDHAHSTDDTIVLEHETRVKGRFKIISEKGVEVRVFLERGKTLKVGEALKTECGKIITIVGAEEAVIEAYGEDWEAFSKACYHLGNRHVKIQVGERWLRMKSDYVLEDMLVLLGLHVSNTVAVFIPEEGAYAGSGHSHGGGHHHH